MDGQLLAVSLTNLQGKELRLLYALLFKTNVSTIVMAKTKDLLKDVDHFNASLQKEADKLETISDEALQLELLLKLTEVYEIKPCSYDTKEALQTQFENIIHTTHKDLLKSDKEFKNFSEHIEEQSELKQLIQYQMQKLFASFDEKLKEYNDDERLQFARKIADVIEVLPQDEQIRLKNRLEIEAVTEQTILQALTMQGTVIVFSAIVEVCGYSAYTSLTTAMASTFALEGVTSPLGIYTFASSLLALLLNPFILIPAVLGGGSWLISRQNKESQKRLVPIILLQMTLPSIIALPEHNDSLTERLLSRWAHLSNNYTELNEHKHALLKQIALDEKQVKALEREHKQITKDLQSIKNEQQAIRSALVNVIYSVDATKQSEGYNSLLEIISRKKERIAANEIEIAQNDEQKGFWRTITKTIDNSGLKNDNRALLEEINRAESQLAEELLQMKGETLQKERQHFAQLQEKENERLNLRSEKAAYAMELRKNVANLEAQLDEVKKEMKDYERKYYGIDQVNER